MEGGEEESGVCVYRRGNEEYLGEVRAFGEYNGCDRGICCYIRKVIKYKMKYFSLLFK